MWPVGTKRLLNVVGMAQSYSNIVDKLPPVVAKLVLRGAPGDITSLETMKYVAFPRIFSATCTRCASTMRRTL